MSTLFHNKFFTFDYFVFQFFFLYVCVKHIGLYVNFNALRCKKIKKENGYFKYRKIENIKKYGNIYFHIHISTKYYRHPIMLLEYPTKKKRWFYSFLIVNCIQDLVSLFNGTSTFVGYLMPKLSLEKTSKWYYSTHTWGRG